MTQMPDARDAAPVRPRPPRKPPPNYFSRKEQLRLFVLCTMFMLVLVAMNEARKPSTWQWLWGESLTPAGAQPPLDTRHEVSQTELPADGFTVEHAPASPRPSPPAELLPGLTPELLEPIQDNSVLRARENPAWLAMFHILANKSAAEIESLSTAEVGYPQLFRQMDTYRGRLVTIAGTLRRLESVQPRANDVGIDSLYRWVLEPVGGSLPVVIYSLEKPAELSDGELREACRITGFCFKKWAYTAADGLRVAPLLLAKGIQWSPAPSAAPTYIPTGTTIMAIVLGLAGVSLAVALAVYRSTVRRRPELERVRAPCLDTLEDFDERQVLPGVGEGLERLAEKDR